MGLTLMGAAPAWGHARGIVVDNCAGCHSADSTAQVSLVAEPATFKPGDSVTLTLTLTWPSIRVGGTYVTTGGVGTLQALAGEGLAVNGGGLTHTTPKTAVGGAVTFRFAWKAPSTPGGVPFYVAALAGNGNNAPTGDAAASGLFQWVFGCAARTSFKDLDRDGYGSGVYGTLLGCADGALADGYAAKDGDCDENDGDVHPGATEVCNGKDDDCNGQIDENAPAVMMWPDADGDGYYKFQTGTSRLGCGKVSGYASLGGDCDDADPAIHPGATEVCNGKDDNCNGSVDERVRPQCGVGWCARESPTCKTADCVPGPPAVETCNLLDDDCNGEVDDNACPSGQTCQVNQCISGGGGTTVPADGGATGGGAGGVQGSGGSGGASGTGGASAMPDASASGGASGSHPGSGGMPMTRPPAGGGCSVIDGVASSACRPDSAWLGSASSGLAVAWLSIRSRRRRRSPRSAASV